MQSQDAGWRGKFAGFALALSLFTVVWFAAAAVGTKLGFWSWQFGLGKMMGNVNAGYARYLIGAAALASILAIILAVIKAPRKQALMLALAALLVIALVGFRWIGFQMNALQLPPIHETQTDWSQPIQPSEALLKARSESGALNTLEDAPTVPMAAEARWPKTGGRLVSELQEEAEYHEGQERPAKQTLYPSIEPLVVPGISPELAFNGALEAVKSKGWEIVTADAATGSIEATQTSFWFGFKDDVMIRVRSEGDGSRVDVRSASRVGLSDLGANPRRVRTLLDNIEHNIVSKS